MRKIMLSICTAMLFYTGAYAQKGTNLLSIAGDFAIPTGSFNDAVYVGPGLKAKFLFGVNNSGYITATTGIDYFNGRTDIFPTNISFNYRIIPILAGYRHVFNKLYLEPQAGVGIYGVTVKTDGFSESDSDNAFTWAMGMGYMGKKIEAGIRYQSGESDGESLAFVGVHIGYMFNLGKNKRQ